MGYRLAFLVRLVRRLVTGGGRSPQGGEKQGDSGRSRTLSENANQPRRSDKEPEAIVLGQEMAGAAEAEERRLAKGQGGKSPMPPGSYNLASDGGLLRPVRQPLDDALPEFCRVYARADDRARAQTRASISMEEFYTLLYFGKRSAVFALRERSADRVVEGLTAIAMIEAERVDFRDVLVTLSLLYHAAARVGANADQLLRGAARLSEPRVADLIEGFIRRSPSQKSLRDSWGYDEVQTEQGVGLIGWGFRSYHPTYDLKKIAIEIADLVGTDKYQPGNIEVATELPAVWLKTESDDELTKALGKVLAGASIHGSPRAGDNPMPWSQMFVVFLVELEDESAAKTLLEITRRKKPEDYCMVGVAEKNLFCLVVARSVVGGVAPIETAKTLPRFEKGLAGILRRHTEKK